MKDTSIPPDWSWHTLYLEHSSKGYNKNTSRRVNYGRRRWKNASRKKGSCGNGSPLCQTCSVPGRSCCRAHIPEPTTRRARCHHGLCTRSGRIKKRSSHTDRVLARVCRETRARLKFNAFPRDMNLGVRGNDERRMEVLAQDLPCFRGAQLAVDITLWSALSPTQSCRAGGRSAGAGPPGQGGHILSC